MHGNSVRFSHESPKKYAGLVDPAVAPTLRQLIQSFPITLEATISDTGNSKNKTRPICDSRNRQLHIVVYGRRPDSEQVGGILADNGLHLQHPHEYDTSVDYINPQYLVRPGSRINIQQSANSATALKSALAKDALGENIKNQILQVFDAADGPQMFQEVKSSPRLVISLKGWVIPLTCI